MNIQFIPGQLYQWKEYRINSIKIWLAGNEQEDIINAIKKIDIKKIDENQITQLVNEIKSHFGIILVNKNLFFAGVDCARTFPLFWANIKSKIYISPQANLIATLLSLKVNKNQLLAFQMSGYTIGTGTLWKDINNINPGSFILKKNNRKPFMKRYFLYNPWIIKEQSHSNLKNTLKLEINKVLNNIITKANNRKIIIPLSAGLDSRLIASGLKELNYKKVKCFSYGLKSNYESKASKYISKKLNYDWEFIELKQKKMGNFFNSREYKKYIQSSNDGCATPSIQDLYPIQKLLDKNYITKNDIIINGNSGDFISGGHIPKNCMNWNNINNKNLFKNIFYEQINKHYSLWESLKNPKNISIIEEEILLQIENILKNEKNIKGHGIYEFLEFENRQCKYVVNLQRTYDYLNLDWYLPLWDKSFIEFWKNVPLKYKINQNLYKETLCELNFAGTWGNNFKFTENISSVKVRYTRYFLKALFILIGKDIWHKFDQKYISYFNDNLCGQSIIPYRKIIKNNNGARNSISWHTLNTEESLLGSNWQNLDIFYNEK